MSKKKPPLYPEPGKQRKKGDVADYHFLPPSVARSQRRSQLRRMEGRWDGKSGYGHIDTSDISEATEAVFQQAKLRMSG